MELNEMLQHVVNNKCSDLHLVTNLPPMVRLDGELNHIPGQTKVDIESMKKMIFSIMSDEQKELFLANKELDFSYPYSDQARFRVNAYYEKGVPAAAFRLIPAKILSIQELGLPDICRSFAALKQGLVLITGPTGHGKSTTIAAILDYINNTRKAHIITIEDPIEYLFTPKMSIISQREMHLDTHSWDLALRSCLREDPDVVLIGEMRDLETIQAALTIAETGHLVFATLHTNSASQSIDRIVGVFEENQQQQIRLQLANVLEGVVSQRLLPLISGGRIPAIEILTGSSAVKTSIREAKNHLIDNIIQTSGENGMVSLDKTLARLVSEGKVQKDTAMAYALHQDDFMTFLRNKS